MWPFRRREEKAASSLDVLRAFMLGRNTAAGQHVNAEVALGVTTVLRCATLLGNGCQQIPFRLYQTPDGGRTRTVVAPAEHPVAKVVTRRPNRWMTPGSFRRTMTMHAALSDFALAIKTRVGKRLIELLPVPPQWVSWKQDDNWRIVYTVSWPQGGRDDFAEDEVFILRGPSWDGVSGLSAVKYAREAIGLRLAVDDSQARLFRNGMRTQGYLKAAVPVSDPGIRTRIETKWAEAFSGTENHGLTPLIEGDLDFKALDLKNIDAETMALRGQQVEEICRAFGVFPQMVGYTGDKSSTYASAEQFFLQHVVHTLQPWHVEWEEATASQLLTDSEQDAGFYFKFTVQALMRGTAKDRAEYYEKMVRMSAYKPADVRSLEEYDFAPEIDRFQIPANTTVLGPDGLPVPLAANNPAPAGA